MSRTDILVGGKVFHRFLRPRPEGIMCTEEEGKTQQSFKDECDINMIVDRYANTGLWSSSQRPPVEKPMYGDFTNVPDFTESMERIRNANEMFDSLPSKLRKRFQNDPAQMLEFINDEKNYDEGVNLGLFNPRPKPEEVVKPNEGKG